VAKSKDGNPRILFTFMKDSVKFSAEYSEPPHNPSESQIEIAGRELIAQASRLRNARLDVQAPIKVEMQEQERE